VSDTMDVRGFNKQEYREIFPQGTVKTPIGEVTIDDVKIAISTYKRKRREVLNKIKKAGVITYEKATGPAGRTG